MQLLAVARSGPPQPLFSAADRIEVGESCRGAAGPGDAWIGAGTEALVRCRAHGLRWESRHLWKGAGAAPGRLRPMAPTGTGAREDGQQPGAEALPAPDPAISPRCAAAAGAGSGLARRMFKQLWLVLLVN